MGKDEEASEENSGEGNPASEEETVEEETVEETEGKKEEAKPKLNEGKTSEKKEKDTEALRKVIKVGEQKEEDNKAEEKKEETPADNTGDSSSREALEQKRAVLQSIKDFDFQIKKNQEEISGVNKKLDAMTKDLDDLVSLYEIVSEQMNPFVGLSKVTKKRLDALENFTREIDILKERTGELESFAERSGVKLKNIAEIKAHAKTIDTDALIGEEEDESDLESKGELDVDEEQVTESSEEESQVEDKKQDETEIEKTSQPEIMPLDQSEDTTLIKEEYIAETQHYMPVTSNNDEKNSFGGLSDSELDMILEKAFGLVSPEGKVDMLIDEFIESLKG